RGSGRGGRAAPGRARGPAREDSGPFRSLEDLASRAGAGRAALEQLAWSGACDVLADGARRAALWRLGVAAPGVDLERGGGEGTQLSLPLDVGAAPALPKLDRWGAMLADYATTGLTAAAHPLALLRDGLLARGAVTAAQLRAAEHGEQVVVGGLTVARQRPGTASGIVFLLLEDETGTINLVVKPEVYERDRLAIRTEPLLIAEGILERHPAAAGGINVLVRRVRALEAPIARPRAEVTDFHPLDEAERERRTGEAGDFRAVAPPVTSFAQGRRR
ncbi:MAG: OB-fold nucleic acid binding domain-containing protein, partial [Baekduiaceae bacterium]